MCVGAIENEKVHCLLRYLDLFTLLRKQEEGKLNQREKLIIAFYYQMNTVSSGIMRYSKNPHKRTRVLGVQADFVLIYRVFPAKSA